MDRCSRMRGFTLLELMVVVAVVAILAAIAFPSFQSTIRSNRLATTANQISTALNLARSQAIENTRGAGVCGSLNGSTCDNAGWNTGVLVWRDDNPNGNLDGGEPVLSYSTVSDQLAVGTGGMITMNFDRRGRATGRDRLNTDLTGVSTITLTSKPCPAGQNLVSTITISATGQTRSERGACP
jgi:type IV fimbrial biogenesis protein FimT